MKLCARQRFPRFRPQFPLPLLDVSIFSETLRPSSTSMKTDMADDKDIKTVLDCHSLVEDHMRRLKMSSLCWLLGWTSIRPFVTAELCLRAGYGQLRPACRQWLSRDCC